MKLLGCIIEEITDHLDFFSFEEHFTQDRYKRFSELCIFLGYCAGVAAQENDTSVRVLREYLVNEMNKLSPDEVFKNFYTSYHIILPYVSIRKFQKLDQFEKCLDIISRHRFISSEVPPHRQMEWSHMQYLIGRQANVSIPDIAILNQNCHLQYFDRALAYAFTHCLFYATDFGFMKSAPPLKDLHKLKFQLECLIARFYEEDDVDLVLELGINYFGLLPHININYGVLQIIDHCLEKTSFIELKCDNTILEKKYHTLLVLGILDALLKTLVNDSNILQTRRTALRQVVSNTIFGNKAYNERTAGMDVLIRSRPELKAWQIIKQLNTKNYDMALYREYEAAFGKNPYLSAEIIFYLKILKDRSESDIMWNREFNYLNVPDNRKTVLNAEFNTKLQDDIAFTAC